MTRLYALAIAFNGSSVGINSKAIEEGGAEWWRVCLLAFSLLFLIIAITFKPWEWEA